MITSTASSEWFCKYNFYSTCCRVGLLSLVLGFVACQPLQKGLDTEDDRNPFFRRAAKLAAEQNFHSALKEYEGALRANPNVPRAHVEMGLIYLDKLGDPVSAIYHFQQYLGNRPAAPDKEQIQTYIDKAKIDFAITLPNSTAQNAEEFARLKKEAMELRQSLAQTQNLLAQARDELAAAGATTRLPAVDPVVPSASTPVIDFATPSSTTSIPAPDPVSPQSNFPPASFAGSTGGRSHVIKQGDSLWKIAKAYYPDDINAGVKKIQDANPQKASNPSALKLGEELIIP